MMWIRQHKGGYRESMATAEPIAGDLDSILAYIDNHWWGGPEPHPSRVKVEPYSTGVDPRNGWDTHVVTITGHGVFGFTDGPVLPSGKGGNSESE